MPQGPRLVRVVNLPSVKFAFIDATSGPVTYSLPLGPLVNDEVVVKDKNGMSLVNNITVVTADGSLIDGQSRVVIVVNYDALNFVWNGEGWSVT